jgi:S-adenosylmethionine-diacylglycerol 3-amino-3-carboxypropyl transferase
MTAAGAPAATPPLDAADVPRVHFTETWEDPRSDARALALEPGDRVLAITAGGCTPLSLLAEAPVHLTTVDYNRAQTHLLELKVAALRRLPSDGVQAFLRDPDEDLAVYRRLRGDLGRPCRAYWDAHLALLRAGVARGGAASRIFYAIGRFLRAVLDAGAREALFACADLEEQRRLYRDHFEHPLVRRLAERVGPLLSLPFALRALLPADYFPYVTERNIPSFIWDRIEHVLTRVPAGDNYFLARILLDRELPGPAGRPPYLRPGGEARLRDNLDRLQVVTAPLEEHLRRLDAGSLDKLQLSNVFEWMPPELVPRTLAEVVRVARPGARVIYRNLFTDRPVPEALRDQLQVDDRLSADLLETDRSFIYSQYWALRVVK